MVRDAAMLPSFGTLLRGHRLAAGLTQELLAERAGLARRTLQELERGTARPQRDTFRRLVAALALTPDERSVLEDAASAPRTPSRSVRGDRMAMPDRVATCPPSVVDHQHPRAILRQGLIPLSLTGLIGRERELADLRVLLAGHRLLTLTGPGGSGKTRLALELATRVHAAYPGGACVVSLAPLTDPRQVASAIADALGVREPPDRASWAGTARSIGERPFLLVLDNFEHLLPAGPSLIDLLSACPKLTLLITSREALRLRGEQAYPVPSLTVPAAGASTAGDDPVSIASESEAVRLFVDRAQGVQPGFRLDASNVGSVADICVRLDGLPLAIELAAARVGHLSLEALRARLRRPLEVLTGGARDLPARQRTLRDAVAWSYDLLSEAERRLFRRLSVFVGGFTLEAAEAVCGDGAPRDETPTSTGYDDAASTVRDSLLDMVASLVEKSLVIPVRVPDDEQRFGQLETIRGLGIERLEACGEAAATRERCAAYFLGLVERAEATLLGHEGLAWLRRISIEHDNVRAVLAWGRDNLVSESIRMRLAGVTIWYWSFRGSFDEGHGWAEAMLAQPVEPARSVTRARALYAAAILTTWEGDYSAARSLARQSAAIYREVDDLRGLGRSLSQQGVAELHDGDREAARSTLAESLTVSRQANNERGVAFALGHFGYLAQCEGDVESARTYGLASASAARAVGDGLALGLALVGLALAARGQGAQAEAAAHFREALLATSEVGVARVAPRALAGLANISCCQGDHQRAARLFGAAEAIRDANGAREVPLWQAIFDRDVADLRASLDDGAFRSAWAEGRAMTLEQAVAYALDEPPSV